MSRDIIFGGTAYEGRTGANRFGTFYSALQPPPPTAIDNGLPLAWSLSTEWAARLAEMTGRVRGLANYGTISRDGTLNVEFPEQYFKYIPIVKASWVTPVVTDTNYRGVPGVLDPFKGKRIIVDTSEFFPMYVQIRDVSVNGCKIVFNPEMYNRVGGNNLVPMFRDDDPKVVVWHAFGL